MSAARVNGIVIATDDETLPTADLRQRACTELLRQAAISAGLLAADDAPPVNGAISEAAAGAIEALLDRELALPEPADDDCRRHYTANAARYAIGERLRLRHILFAVTAGVDVSALRARAEACLIDLRAHDGSAPDARFATAARQWSNCPSGAAGGDLGWVSAADCAPEFARDLFGQDTVGILPRLVHSRFGLHVVEILAREPGRTPPFEERKAAVAQVLRQQAFASALRRYLHALAEAAEVDGVDLDAAVAGNA